MKRLSLVLTILFTMLHAHLYAATFTASQIEITPGQTAQLVIGMNNTETNLSGFQFKLYLPEGLSVTTNANGQFVYTQSGRIANHDVNFRALDDGGYLVVVYSMEADIISGSSGELMSISVTADETASTSGKGTLSNIRITDVTSSTNSCDDVPIDVTILNAHPHDVTFTASQIEITPGQTAQLVIGMNNTETNLSGFQFKLYLPEGLSVTTNTNGQFVYTLSERIANHAVNIRALNDGGYLVVVYSMDANVITGSSGELMSISVTADETASTSGNGTLSNIRITDVTSSTSSCDDVPIDIIIVPKVHYVTFKYGETVYLHEQVAYGAAVPVPDNPTLKGHTFAGWIPDVPETMPDEDLVFTAVFTVNQYTATFTIPSEDWSEVLTLDYGSAITAPIPPTKPGYAFAGWDKPIPETMPDTDLVFTGTYTQNFQTLSLTATGNGSISYGNSSVRSSSQSFDVAELSDVVLTITPDAGHHVETLLVNGEDALSELTDGKLSIGSMTSSVTVAVTFAANVIDFADANVKALCVANWDTNGDGELDEAEAAAVTDLGEVFKDNETITSFNELQYFTGLTSIGDYAFDGCIGLTSITIPESLTSIGDYAFYYCTSLTSITIPESVISIGDYAFNYCTSLTSITILESVTSIGDGAFFDCISLTSITIPESVTSIGDYAFYSCYGLTYITIPESVTSIGNAPFGACYGLTSIKVDAGNTVYDSRDNCNAIIDKDSNTLISGCMNTVIPNSVTSIGDEAFRLCKGLTSVTIPESLTNIGDFAFCDCYGLTSITIPESLTSIGDGAFGYCSSLTSIKVEMGNTKYDSRNDCNAIIETTTNTLITGCQNTVIPNSVTSIGDYAFDGCFGLTSITIPNSVTSIGYEAFRFCKGLTSVTIPESVISIGDFVFSDCYGLTSITIPESVNSIGKYAFYCCNRLTEVYCYAEQVPNTDSKAFSNTNIENATLYVPKGSVELYKAASPWSYFGTIEEIPSTSNIIEFADAGVKALCVANWDTNGDGELSYDEAAAVTDIGIVFRDNETITSFNELQYFTGLTSIGEGAFYYCKSLTSITIPDGVTSIGNSAFYFCYGLTAIVIGNSVTSIGSEAFWYCDGLTSVTIPNSVTSIGDRAFAGCRGLTSVTIPNSVTSIGGEAFAGCENLTSITIPNSVTSIGIALFSACSSLISIKVDEGNTIYDSRNNCNAIIETKSNTLVASCMNTVIPESVTSIGEGAFLYCKSFTSITIPDGVTSIGYEAFGYCSGLTSITIPNSVTSIGTEAFWHCTSLTEVYCYAKQVPSTANDAFDYANIENATLYVPRVSIESYKAASPWSGFGTIVAIPGTDPDIAKIGSLWYAIDTETKQATVIESKDDEYSGDIAIPASVLYQDETYAVTEIDGSAFNGCSGLTAITIPNSVTRLPRFGFSGCNNLATVTLDCWAIISKVYPGQSSSEFARLFGDQVKECIIGNSVTYIGNFFEDCSSIESITIGSNVEEIRFGAFRGCDLVSITVNAENSTYDSRDNCNAIIDTNNNILVLGCRNTVIPSSVKNIDARAFYCCSLTSITIPSSVTLISTEAFYGCSGLTNITSHIKEPFAIDNSVFEGIPYETATLFVPAGTVDAYKTTDGWKNFQNIEVIPQQLTIVAVGDGTVTFSGETLTKTTATFKVAGEVQLLLTPEEGCHIERVMVNHQDYTSQMTDGKLTLNVVDEDYFVLAEFEHNAVPEPTYVNYTIYFDGHGDVRVKGETLKESGQRIQVPQGGDLVLEFLPDEGQMVDKVTLNGETVTEQILGNTLVVRDVQEDGTVSVIFMEQIETFEYAGIRYGVTDNTQRTLKVLPYDYSGHLSIPESIEHSQRTWQVQEIGNLAFANCEWLVSVKIPSSITKVGQNLFKRDTRLAAIQWDAQPLLEEKVTGELTNANMLYYVKDKSIAPQGGNVIVNGKADNIILSDSYDFYCPEAFKAEKIAYSHIYRMLTRRKSCQGWETLVLPFDVETIRLSRDPDNPEIYPYESLTDNDKVERGETLPFWLYSYGDDDTFTPAASIEANTPYIISMPNDVAYLPEFRLAGNVTFSAHDVDVHCTSDENLKVPGTQRHFQPSYQRKAMGNDCYLVNVDDSINHKFAEGSKFIQALRPARPFEAYMISQTASVKPWYDIFEQIPTEIRDLPVRDEEQGRERVYDLSGREVSGERTANGRLPKGIYIINGKKQIMK